MPARTKSGLFPSIVFFRASRSVLRVRHFNQAAHERQRIRAMGRKLTADCVRLQRRAGYQPASVGGTKRTSFVSECFVLLFSLRVSMSLDVMECAPPCVMACVYPCCVNRSLESWGEGEAFVFSSPFFFYSEGEIPHFPLTSRGSNSACCVACEFVFLKPVVRSTRLKTALPSKFRCFRV